MRKTDVPLLKSEKVEFMCKNATAVWTVDRADIQSSADESAAMCFGSAAAEFLAV